jgi:hypothetical protein
MAGSGNHTGHRAGTAVRAAETGMIAGAGRGQQSEGRAKQAEDGMDSHFSGP